MYDLEMISGKMERFAFAHVTVRHRQVNPQFHSKVSIGLATADSEEIVGAPPSLFRTRFLNCQKVEVMSTHLVLQIVEFAPMSLWMTIERLYVGGGNATGKLYAF